MLIILSSIVRNKPAKPVSSGFEGAEQGYGLLKRMGVQLESDGKPTHFR